MAVTCNTSVTAPENARWTLDVTVLLQFLMIADTIPHKVTTDVCYGYEDYGGRISGLMVCALLPESSGLDPAQGHCISFLRNMLYSQSASLYPGV